MSLFKFYRGWKCQHFVLESADCHVNKVFFFPCAGVTIRGPEFLVGTKCHYLSMQESRHDIPWPLWQWQTYANEGECHSHYDPVTETLTPPTGPWTHWKLGGGTEKERLMVKEARQWPNSEERKGATLSFTLSLLLFILSPHSLCNLSHRFQWPICLTKAFFLSLLCSGKRDRFTWAGFFEVKMQTTPCCSQSSSNQGLIPVIKIWEITLIHHSPSTPIG